MQQACSICHISDSITVLVEWILMFLQLFIGGELWRNRIWSFEWYLVTLCFLLLLLTRNNVGNIGDWQVSRDFYQYFGGIKESVWLVYCQQGIITQRKHMYQIRTTYRWTFILPPSASYSSDATSIQAFSTMINMSRSLDCGLFTKCTQSTVSRLHEKSPSLPQRVFWTKITLTLRHH